MRFFLEWFSKWILQIIVYALMCIPVYLGMITHPAYIFTYGIICGVIWYGVALQIDGKIKIDSED